MTHLTQSSKTCEFYTPAYIVEAAREAMAWIDLDPASCAAANEIVKAKNFYSLKDDGLKQPWHGRVWLNPPYTRGVIDKFVQKLYSAVNGSCTVDRAVVLVNNATETWWFQRLLELQSGICFLNHRVSFLGPDLQPLENNNRGQVAFYIGPNADLFLESFMLLGKVI